MNTLFDNSNDASLNNGSLMPQDFKIKGLNYIPNFITQTEHDLLLTKIDHQIWLTDLKRRVQHYGYKYDYKLHRIDSSMKISQLPNWLFDFSKKLYQQGIFSEIPDQVIINEYLPGQGISNHIDCPPCFSDTIASLSLGSECVMYLTNKANENEKIPCLLQPNSVLVLKEDARYCWMHGIKAVKTDNYNGKKIVRQRRVSLTFRKVIM